MEIQSNYDALKKFVEKYNKKNPDTILQVNFSIDKLMNQWNIKLFLFENTHERHPVLSHICRLNCEATDNHKEDLSKIMIEWIKTGSDKAMREASLKRIIEQRGGNIEDWQINTWKPYDILRDD